MKTYGYLRVSTTQQDYAAQKHGILEYANKCGITGIHFVDDTASGKISWRLRKVGELLQQAEPGDTFLFAEFSRIGRSTLQVLEFLHEAAEKNIRVHIVKQNMIVDGSIQSRIISTIMGLVAEMEREFTSRRTKEGQAVARANGKIIGRHHGSKNKSRKLDEHAANIPHWVKTVGMTATAKLCDCATSTLYDYCRDKSIPIPEKRKPKVTENENRN